LFFVVCAPEDVLDLGGGFLDHLLDFLPFDPSDLAVPEAGADGAHHSAEALAQVGEVEADAELTAFPHAFIGLLDFFPVLVQLGLAFLGDGVVRFLFREGTP
jgi:hypothetical protein